MGTCSYGGSFGGDRLQSQEPPGTLRIFIRCAGGLIGKGHPCVLSTLCGLVFHRCKGTESLGRGRTIMICT